VNELYVFKFAAFVNVKRSPSEATSTAFLNGMDFSCSMQEKFVSVNFISTFVSNFLVIIYLRFGTASLSYH
jgi:hypothetical protein